jgi:hypothetical protein
MKKLFLL